LIDWTYLNIWKVNEKTTQGFEYDPKLKADFGMRKI